MAGEHFEREGEDEEHWAQQPQANWQPDNPPAGKSRGEILETWTDM